MSYKSDLKKYLPEIHRNQNVDEICDGLGELLDNFNTEIHNLRWIVDPDRLKTSLIETFGSDLGIHFPVALSESKKRTMLRDAINAYRQTGTEDALIRIFRLIGWDVTIDKVWTLYTASTSLSTRYLTGNTATYSQNPNFVYTSAANLPIGPNEFIFGDISLDTSNGKWYADLYDDFGNTYLHVPFYGESYDGEQPQVIKLPYIRIKINNQDYADYISDYIDPETGEKRSYTTSERFAMINDAIEYMLDDGRPANVAIIDILVSLNMVDEIVPVPDDSITNVPYFPTAKYTGEFIYDAGIDPARFGDIYEMAKYDDPVYIDTTPPIVSYTRTYNAGMSGLMEHCQIRTTDTIVRITATDSTDQINVLVSTTDRVNMSSGVFWVYLTLTGQTTYPDIQLHGLTAVKLEFVNPLQGTVNMEIELR